VLYAKVEITGPQMMEVASDAPFQLGPAWNDRYGMCPSAGHTPRVWSCRPQIHAGRRSLRIIWDKRKSSRENKDFREMHHFCKE